jgi:hypothetical protein
MEDNGDVMTHFGLFRQQAALLPFKALALVFLAAMLSGQVQAGIIGYWTFNEGSGTTAYDSSGNGNNGTLQAIPGGGATPVYVANTNSATSGQAYSLSFDQGVVSIGDSASINTLGSAFTMSAWVLDTGDNYGELFADSTSSGNRYWLFQDSDYGGDQDYFWSDTNSGFHKALGYATPLNTWEYVTLTYDGSDLRLYDDGTLEHTVAMSGSLTDSGGLFLGAASNNSGYGSGIEGQLEDMLLLNTAATGTQVEDLYDGSNPLTLFGDASPTPEPSTWALLGAGIALLGFLKNSSKPQPSR